MSEQKSASQTAETTLLLRAVACFEEGDSRGKDHLAELFLPEEKRKKLRSEAYRKAVKAALPEGLYAYIVARTAYFDEAFTAALAAGFPQIVLLGAGYDSRAYRLVPSAGKVTIFEVDAPPTQERKLLLLGKTAGEHGGIVYVPVDFEKDDLQRCLAAKGYAPARKTLFIWEGVTPYLTPESVWATLATLRAMAAPGSVLAFDYLNRAVSEEDGIRRKDERVLFGMESAALESRLGQRGWRVLENLESAKETMCFLKAEATE